MVRIGRSRKRKCRSLRLFAICLSYTLFLEILFFGGIDGKQASNKSLAASLLSFVAAGVGIYPLGSADRTLHRQSTLLALCLNSVTLALLSSVNINYIQVGSENTLRVMAGVAQSWIAELSLVAALFYLGPYFGDSEQDSCSRAKPPAQRESAVVRNVNQPPAHPSNVNNNSECSGGKMQASSTPPVHHINNIG